MREILAKEMKEITLYLENSKEIDSASIWPVDRVAEITNYCNLSYGISGILYSIFKIQKGIDKLLVSHLLDRINLYRDKIPSGLYIGMSGIAWILHVLGESDCAVKLMIRANRSSLNYSNHTIFYGEAGRGLANLYFYKKKNVQQYLDQAKKIADYLFSVSKRDSNGNIFWYNKNNVNVEYGYAHGASGVALFFLLLYKFENSAIYLDYAKRALEFDLSHAVNSIDGLAWPAHSLNTNTLHPYWDYGSAGVGGVLLRFYIILGESRYLELARKAAEYTMSRFSILPNLFTGLSSLADFLIDVFQLTEEKKYRYAIEEIFKTILLYRLKQKKIEGVVYPGSNLLKISCDMATGSSGIGLVMNRYVYNEKKDFIDELIF